MNYYDDLFDGLEEDEIEEYGIEELDSYDENGEYEEELYNDEEQMLIDEDADIGYDMDEEFEN